MSNETEIEFVNGLIVKAPREGAPEFVKAALSFKREELIAWLQGQQGDWINVQVKEARSGKWYAAVDTWKPKEASGPRRDEFSDNGNGTPRSNAPRHQRQAPAPAGGFDDAPLDDDIPFITNRSNF